MDFRNSYTSKLKVTDIKFRKKRTLKYKYGFRVYLFDI